VIDYLANLSGYLEETVLPLSERPTEFEGETLSGYGPAASLRVQARCTAIDGIPNSPSTMTVQIADTLDGQNWNTLATLRLSPGSTSRAVANVTGPFADRLRVGTALGSYSGTTRPQQATVGAIL